jgi:hypothetical protein
MFHAKCTLTLISLLTGIIPVAAQASGFSSFDYPGPVSGPHAVIGTEVWNGNENGDVRGALPNAATVSIKSQ